MEGSFEHQFKQDKILEYTRQNVKIRIKTWILSLLSLQVFVFSRTAYSMIKERLKSKGVADITAKELEGYFSPWHAKHIGQIKVKV